MRPQADPPMSYDDLFGMVLEEFAPGVFVACITRRTTSKLRVLTMVDVRTPERRTAELFGVPDEWVHRTAEDRDAR